MRKLIAVVILALAGFYVAWPAWSGYQIRNAFLTDDVALLAHKVDFPLVRQSLRPVVAAEVRATVERLGRGSGALGQLIAASVKDDLIERIADATVEGVVTPEATLRMVRQGGNLRDAFRRVMAEQVGRSEGLSGRRSPPEATPPVAPPQPPTGQAPAPSGDQPRKLGIANIKSFGMTGPATFQFGLVRDPAANTPDVYVEMGFRRFDWKVIGVIPRPLNPS